MKTKSLFLVLFILFVIISCCPRNSYGQEEKYSIPKSQLTTEQLKAIEQAELEKKLEQYGKWVGVGGEVGQAVREGLEAVVDVADKAGDTNVGKFTMYLIAWKVIGKDLIRIILGIIFAFIFTIFIFRFARKSFAVQRVMIENPGFFKFPKKYKVINPLEQDTNKDYLSYKKWENAILYKILFSIILIGGYGITYAIMFG